MKLMIGLSLLTLSLVVPPTLLAYDSDDYGRGGIQEDMAAIRRNQHRLNYAEDDEATRIRKDTKRRVQRLRDYGIEVSDHGTFYSTKRYKKNSNRYFGERESHRNHRDNRFFTRQQE